MNIVFEARLFVSAGDGFSAGAKREDFLYQSQCFANGTGTGERAEVSSTVFLKTASNINTGPIFSDIYFKIGESFIVF